MGNWRIFESIWLSMLTQFDSQCWVNLTPNVESIWLSMLTQFDSQCWVNLTLNVESIWLPMLSQFDSQCWVNLTLNVESIWLSMLSLFDYNILQLSTLPGRILVPQVTQLFRSKWLNFFCQCIIDGRRDYSELADATPQAINQDFGISIYIYVFFAFLVKKTSGILFSGIK